MFIQAEDDLKSAHSMDQSADILKLQEQIKQAEIRIHQMATERETLMERLTVSPREEPLNV